MSTPENPSIKNEKENKIYENEDKGDDDMIATTTGRNYATIIRHEKREAFAKMMRDSIPTKEFWNDCKRARESFDDEEIKRMREISRNAENK